MVRASSTPWWNTAARRKRLRNIATRSPSAPGLGTGGISLVGNADYIKRANRWRKMTGGGMRQAGILAAAGLYALKNNVARLKDDHDNVMWMAARS